jgi:hypothetical protein
MEFQTISVFEKSGAQIEAELWATPGWFKLTQCFLYDSNPYVSKMDLKSTEDGSYVEYHIYWHNEEAYATWLEEWSTVHNDIKPRVLENLNSREIQHTLYWPETSIEPPVKNDNIVSLDSFVSKITA